MMALLGMLFALCCAAFVGYMKGYLDADNRHPIRPTYYAKTTVLFTQTKYDVATPATIEELIGEVTEWT